MDAIVIETVMFRIIDGVREDDFLSAAEQSNEFVAACPGFVRRRLSREENGAWIDHVEWASMADAKAAAARIGADERARAFVRAIDGASVTLMHSELKLSLG
jgi:antibiotic biosynthesis monooxygenase (ABM) superfamily enzyme